MRIALLAPTFAPFSGIDRLVEINAGKYVSKGHKVLIMCLKAEMKSRHARIVELGMPKIPILERLYRLFFFLDRAKIGRAASALKGYDLAVSHFYPMNLIALVAKRRYGCKYQYYNAGVAWPRLFSNPLERAYMWLFNKLSNATIRGCDSAVSISKFLRNELKGETGIKSEVRYIPVDKKRFHPGISGARVRKKFGLGNAPVLLYVGRVSPHKGVHLLIRAYKTAKLRLPGLKLLIVGKHTFAGYSKRLKAMADEGVTFAGFVPDEELPGYYAACDLYVTASLWEGYDLPAAEAQACGKRVVAFDAGSHREIVEKGKLVPSADVEGFAKAIVKELR